MVDIIMAQIALNVESIIYGVINQMQILECICLTLRLNKMKTFDIDVFQISHIINSLYTLCLLEWKGML